MRPREGLSRPDGFATGAPTIVGYLPLLTSKNHCPFGHWLRSTPA